MLRLIFISLLLPTALFAETLCYTDLDYQWAKEDQKPVAVTWSRVSSSGTDEQDARNKLDELLAREKVKAEEACSRKHQNLSGCIASKISQNKTVLASSGFAVRKTLEEAISSDCKASQGSCQGIAKFEIKCREVSKAPAAEEKVEKEKPVEAEKKNSKKKKKKK